MERPLKLAANLSLPLDAVTQTFAILARKGAGKTHTAMVMTEEMVKAALQVVALDPLGAWWGLRSSADGESQGLPITIIGGEHGDVPLEPTAGKVIADLVVDHGGSFVIDMSLFESNGAQDKFAMEFAERIYRAKASQRSPLHLMVDEADSFAPQRPQPGQQRMLGAFEAIVRRGRIRGLGATLISQRPAVINKNVLTQTECLIALQVTGPQDRAAIDDWVKGNASSEVRDELMKSLASLQRGEAWFWSPSWLQTFEKVQVRAKETFDSSRTPTAGELVVEPRAVAPVDLDDLRQRIAATIEKAEASDPKRLQRRIRELEKKVAEHTCPVPAAAVGIKPSDLALAETALWSIESSTASLAKFLEGLTASEGPQLSTVQPLPPAPARPITFTEAPEQGQEKLGKGEKTVLGVLAQWPQGRTHNELAFLAGYSAKASTLGVILGKLRRLGYVEEGQPIRLTPEGLEAAGGPQDLPSGTELLDHWRNHPRMGEGERRVLDVLIAQYPADLSNAELCELAGYSPTASTVGVILSKLRKLGLVEKSARRVAPEFMDSIAS